MKVLLIDAYDSFVYIVKNYIDVMGHDTEIVRCDAVNYDCLENYEAIVLGPGPGHPTECGYLKIIELAEGKIPVLGICLGMQAIAEYYGVSVIPATNRRHGKVSNIETDGTSCFSGLPKVFEVTRYHSLVADESNINNETPLRVTARSLDDNYIMGLRHKNFYIEGVQFHPESIKTQHGYQVIANFFENYI